MSSHLQLQILKKEGKVLQKLHAKLSDQLSRLKVEELALLSEIKESQPKNEAVSNSVTFEPPKQEQPEPSTMHQDVMMEGHAEANMIEINPINDQPLLNLQPPMQNMLMVEGNIIEEEEEEEEEDEDEEMTDEAEEFSGEDELAKFVEGLQRQSQM